MSNLYGDMGFQLVNRGPASAYKQGIPRTGYPNNGNLTGSTNYRSKVRGFVPIGQDLVDPVVCVGNLKAAFPEGVPTNTGQTWRAAIEYPVGVALIPMFSNGSRDLALAPGSIGQFDPACITIPGGANFRLHLRVIVATTTDTVSTTTIGMITGGSDAYAADLTTTDNTSALGATYPTMNASFALSPLAILGRRQAVGGGMSSVALVGDSIMSDIGDAVGDPSGFAPRAINNTRPWGMFSQPTMQAAHWTTSSYLHLGAITQGGYTHALCNMGVNDIGAGHTLAQIQSDLTGMWTLLTARGIQVWQTTITPQTTSTDSWATTVNQTPAAGFGPNSVWSKLNDWIRTAPAPLAGYIEVADTVTTSRNSGIWVPGLVFLTDTQGIHPSPAGHAAMAAAVAPVVQTW